MKVLVVGASGHLGAHLTRLLLAAGHDVRALTRPTSNPAGLADLAVERVHGDVLDPASLARAVRGCRQVYHLAAPTGHDANAGRIIQDGTANVLRAAETEGVERLVYTSSVVTVGYSDDPAVVLDEASNQFTPATPYHTAKWKAEKHALEDSRVPVVVVNPATIVGPLDHRVTPSNAPIAQGVRRGLPVSFASGVTIVHAEDVARGHLLAMTAGRPGQRYILGGDRLTIPDYFRLICELSGRRGPTLRLPRWVMLSLGLGFSCLSKLGKRGVPFTYTQARQLVGRYGWYSSDKARRELGYSWRPAREAVASSVEWFRRSQAA
jgi:dihydroflavonol-4-reductase